MILANTIRYCVLLHCIYRANIASFVPFLSPSSCTNISIMHSLTARLLATALALGSFALASPVPNFDDAPLMKDKRSFVERDGTNYTVFEHAATGAKMEFVTNSGICETTKGVNQYSGYLSVGTNMNMSVTLPLLGSVA